MISVILQSDVECIILSNNNIDSLGAEIIATSPEYSTYDSREQAILKLNNEFRTMKGESF